MVLPVQGSLDAPCRGASEIFSRVKYLADAGLVSAHEHLLEIDVSSEVFLPCALFTTHVDVLFFLFLFSIC